MPLQRIRPPARGFADVQIHEEAIPDHTTSRDMRAAPERQHTSSSAQRCVSSRASTTPWNLVTPRLPDAGCIRRLKARRN